jgi:phosphate transport system permease protein
MALASEPQFPQVSSDEREQALQLLRSSLGRGQRLREKLIERLLLWCGLLSIIVTLAIAGVVIYGSAIFFTHDEHKEFTVSGEDEFGPMKAEYVWERVGYFFTGTKWTGIIYDQKSGRYLYGILPLLVGTLIVALIAAAIALPIGLITAIYLSEYAAPRVRAIAKPTLELLAGIPTVVYGFFAITVVTPFLAQIIPGLDNNQNMLSGGIVVGIMIIPMVASLSEDALRAVPRSLRDGAFALGANKYETSVKVVLPSALSGVIASFLLAISRAVGETMAVSLACGGRTMLQFDPRQGAATMTSFITSVAKGDANQYTTIFYSIFAVAGLLFFVTLFMNVVAQMVLKKYRQVYQ